MDIRQTYDYHPLFSAIRKDKCIEMIFATEILSSFDFIEKTSGRLCNSQVASGGDGSTASRALPV